MSEGGARIVHKRTSKACELCRRRKKKCDGTFPCSECVRGMGAANCKYRERNRVRQSRAARAERVTKRTPYPSSVSTSPVRDVHHDDSAQVSHHGDEDTDTEDEGTQGLISATHGQGVLHSVNASLASVQLHYGPSSNFAFLQQIHQTCAEPGRRTTEKHDSFDRFKQKDRFFGPDQLLSHGNGAYPQPAQPVFLPESLAQVFLANFTDTILHMTPFLTKERLSLLLDSLYGHGSAHHSAFGDLAVILLALANGATLTRHHVWVEDLLERAKAEIRVFEHLVNLRSVQIMLLIGHCYTSLGRPNATYLQLGTACRKAFAAGLHRDVDYKHSSEGAAERAEERRLTFWSLGFFERWTALWLGRPSALDHIRITTPLPTSSPLVLALSELTAVTAQTWREIYDSPQPTPVKLWKSAREVQSALTAARLRLEPVLGFSLEGNGEGPLVVDQLFMMNCYHYAWMITFRPFLIIDLARQRGPMSQGQGQETMRATPGKASLSVTDQDRNGAGTADLKWLPEACAIAVEHAHILIRFFARVADTNRLARGLVFSASYMESACTLLFYDSIRDNSTMPHNVLAMEAALKALSRMVEGGPAPSIGHTVQQLISELKLMQVDEMPVTRSPTVSQPRDPPQELARRERLTPSGPAMSALAFPSTANVNYTLVQGGSQPVQAGAGMRLGMPTLPEFEFMSQLDSLIWDQNLLPPTTILDHSLPLPGIAGSQKGVGAARDHTANAVFHASTATEHTASTSATDSKAQKGVQTARYSGSRSGVPQPTQMSSDWPLSDLSDTWMPTAFDQDLSISNLGTYFDPK